MVDRKATNLPRKKYSKFAELPFLQFSYLLLKNLIDRETVFH